ncbi:hypothetical protein PBY51_001320 [Eleginops maclovinus]|uniref:Uncharacterized protein n=1 Tax=Eleginops maclovinus TaxID=56733 RepID=A0AAN8AC87_ELEMC|nr:hypothetical protein PBY51_001320 [Eleginops maclovinus]
MITGGRAPSREPPPCLPPISSQSAGHAVTCFLCRGFVFSQLFHTVRDPSTVHSTAPLHLHQRRGLLS